MQYKGDNMKNDDTKLVFCTDGLVTAWLKSDPMLKDYNSVIIDEAHERNMNIDLLLLQLKEIARKRKDFKLIIMSATISTDLFSNYFPKNEFKFGLLELEGAKMYEVADHFLPDNEITYKFDNDGVVKNKDQIIEKAIDRAIDILKTTESGDILVFVPGGGDGGNSMSNSKR